MFHYCIPSIYDVTITYYLADHFQVAAQQGAYLAKCFNNMHECEAVPQGPRRITQPGRHRFHPFR